MHLVASPSSIDHFSTTADKYNHSPAMKRSMSSLSAKFDDEDFKHVSDAKKHKCKYAPCSVPFLISLADPCYSFNEH